MPLLFMPRFGPLAWSLKNVFLNLRLAAFCPCSAPDP